MSLFVVIGPGAVGCAVAFQLQSGHLPYVLFGRGGMHLKPLSVTLRGHTTNLRPISPPSFNWSDVSAVFVCVKVYDLVDCLKTYAPKIPKGATVVVTANGYIDGMVRDAMREYPELHWRLGIAQLGSTEVPDGFVLAGNGGSVSIGWDPGTIPTAVEKQLQAVSPKFFQVLGDVTAAYRKKWLLNVVANSFAGANRLSRNNLMLEREAELKAVLDEGYALGEKLWGPWPLKESEFWDYFLSVIHATGENENSMARDVRLGRRNESAYLAGTALRFPGFPRLKELHKILSGP